MLETEWTAAVKAYTIFSGRNSRLACEETKTNLRLFFKTSLFKEVINNQIEPTSLLVNWTSQVSIIIDDFLDRRNYRQVEVSIIGALVVHVKRRFFRKRLVQKQFCCDRSHRATHGRTPCAVVQNL